ncbi:MAG: LysR family transcriptional regulator [Mesorhizobium sp.]|nr:MAG: LysR family transcriptional regulator [Mesorhizobium sp.]
MVYIVTMREVDLRRIDLNLLVALEALLDEKNVTRAASRLGMSQPAASRALGRLRALFSDALLVDGPGGYILAVEALEQGSADAMVALVDEAPAGIRRRGLYDEKLVTLMRAEHPALARKLTLERFLELEHIVVSVTGVGPAPVDEVLARIGRTRRVKLRVPNFFAAVEIAARSDLVMTLPSSLARAAANMKRFVSLPPPLDLGSFTMSLVWHARQQDAPRHIWLRRAIVAAAADMSSAIDVGN